VLLLQCATSLLSPEPYLPTSPYISLYLPTSPCISLHLPDQRPFSPEPEPSRPPMPQLNPWPIPTPAPTLAPPLTLAPDPNPCPDLGPNPPQVPLALLGGGAGWGVKWWYDRRSRQRMRTILQALTRWP